jgi:hypothetical protein
VSQSLVWSPRPQTTHSSSLSIKMPLQESFHTTHIHSMPSRMYFVDIFLRCPLEGEVQGSSSIVVVSHIRANWSHRNRKLVSRIVIFYDTHQNLDAGLTGICGPFWNEESRIIML